jgi:thiosulfate dehydrogenase (quinone) large subunit
MLTAFLESVKYTGHLIPVAFLRIFLGYWYLQQALLKFSGDFLHRPRLASQISENLSVLHLSPWYKNLIEVAVVQHWQTCAFIILGLEFAIAVSYLIGYVVRPVAILAAFMSINMLILSVPGGTGYGIDQWRTFTALHLALAWISAGRCLGLDYFFFKRRRGIWW